METKKKCEESTQYEKRATRRAVRAFHEAIKQGDSRLVEELLQTKIDVNFHYGGQSALQISVTKGLVDISRMLIQRGADVDKRNAEENSLLNMAVWRNYGRICQLLVDHNADLNATNNHNSSALNTAAYRGYADIAQILVTAGCNLNQADNRGQTPLSTAAREGHVGVVTCLLGAQCDLDSSNNEGKTALMLAVESGHTEIVKALLDAGCSYDAAENYRCTALYFAAKEGHFESAKLVLEKGANFNACNTKGTTPLMEAVRAQHVHIARLLTSAGCDLNLAEYDRRQAPIHTAVRIASQFFGSRDTQMELVEMLVDAGCDLNVADKSGWTPLYQAASGGELDIVKLLLGHGAAVDRCTETGDTMLHGAVFGNTPAVLNLVLDAGCSVNAVNKRNELPLYTAITNRSKIEIIQRLLEAGSQTDTCESDGGQSPLFAAIQQDYSEAANLLIRAGCDVNSPNADGDTPLWVACNKGNDVMVAILLQQPSVDVDAGISHIPLHAAATLGYLSIVERLLEAGCDVNKLTDLGVSAVYLATDMNHVTVVKRLLYWGANPSAHHDMKLPQKCCGTYTDPHPHLELEPLYAAIKNDNFMAVKCVLLGTPRMPYKVLQTLRDILFRTNYAREARLSQSTLVQHATLFGNILSRPRHLQEGCRSIIRECLGARPAGKVETLPLPPKLKDYILLKKLLIDAGTE